MKKVIVFLLVSLFISIPMVAYAEESDEDLIYNEQLQSLGLDELQGIDDEKEEYLDKLNISDPINGISDFFTAENVFDIIGDFLKNNIKTPLKCGFCVIAVLLISSVVSNIGENHKLVHYAVTVCLASSVLVPALSTVSVCAEAIKTSGTFMLSFLPIYAAVLSSSGKPLTSVGFSSVMTVAVQAVTAACSYLFVPLTGMQLSLGLCGSVAGDVRIQPVQNAIKKVSMISLSFVCTVFLGILGVQTAINSPADNLYSKTARFVIGSAVPYVGGAVSEALNTVRGCVSLLRSSVMIYGVVAVALIVLPIIIQLFLWRCVLLMCCTVAEAFDNTVAVSFLKSVDNAVSFLLGITVLLLVMFVISLTLVAVI